MNRKERERIRKKMEDAKRDRVITAIRAAYDRKHIMIPGIT